MMDPSLAFDIHVCVLTRIMYRLARLGNVYPIGQNSGTVNVNGQNWELWIGYNGSMKVFSFIAQGTTNSWSGDAKQFFSYLERAQGFPSSQQNLIGKLSLIFRQKNLKRNMG